MAPTTTDTIDFTLMYATHEAFRRDVGRLKTAALSATTGSPAVRAGWENFRRQLLIHHEVEDENLWPQVERKVADRPDALALLTEMEAEHALLDPLLESVDARLESGDEELRDEIHRLQEVLDHHLRHEEDSALPLIQEVLTRAEWGTFAAGMRRKQGVRGAVVYIPWAVDGASSVRQDEFFAAMPGPTRALNRLVLQRHYRRLALWGPAAGRDGGEQ